MLAQPRAYLNMLCAVDFYLHPTREFAIAGKRDGIQTQQILKIIHARYIPNKILALLEPGAPDFELAEEQIPLLSGKTMISNKTTVYICENYACKNPVTVEAFEEMLDGGF